ncbi:MAG: DUF1048 domain-containing protein [Clostridiales bacterium]|nr:DUF1048 domain-containing protein [Clostridiales bacterium]
MSKMTKQSRWIIYTSLFVSGAVIFTTLLYFFSAKETSEVNITWILITIIAIAVASAFIVYYTRKKLRTRAKLLNEDFFIAYEAISDSMEGSVLSYYEKKETLKDILGLFIDAQNSGRTADQVTGGDLKMFVKKVQDSFGYRNRFIFTLLSGLEYAIMYLFMVQIYEWVRGSEELGFFESKPGYSMMIFLLPIAFIGIPLMRYFIRKQKMFLAIGVLILLFGINVAFMEITYVKFMHIDWIRGIHEDVFSYVPGWGFLVFWIGLLGASLGLKWFIRKRSIENL